MRRLWERYARGLPLLGFASSLGSTGVRMVLLLGQIALVARALGPAQFGEFSVLVALCAALGALSGWGGSVLYVRDLSRSENGIGLLARTLRMFVMSSFLLVLVAVAVQYFFFPGRMTLAAIAAVAVSDLALGALTPHATRILFAHDRYRALMLLKFIAAGARLAAAAIFTLVATHDVNVWAWYYLAASALTALACLHLSFNWRSVAARPVWLGRELVEGLTFASGSAMQIARRNLDRPLAFALLGPEFAGAYAAAARLVDAAIMPMYSVLNVTQRRFFHLGHTSHADMWGLLRTMGIVIGLVGLMAALGLAIISPLMRTLFGPDYAAAAPIVLALAPLPFISGFIALGNDVLAAQGEQAVRVLAELLGCAMKVAIALALVPSYGWIGFAVAILVADSSIAACVWFRLLRPRAVAT